MGDIVRCGIGYRRPLHDKILANADQIDCLEVLVEQFLPLSDANRRLLQFLAERFEIVLHGVGLSLGSVTAPQPNVLPVVREMAAISGATYFSEHVSFSRSGGRDLWHLSPVPRSKDSLQTLIERVAATQEALRMPVVLETITLPFQLTGEDFGWGDFHKAICERTGAELLVDITNLTVNAINGVGPSVTEALESIAAVPWRQVHVIGYSMDHHGWAVDSHDTAIDDDLMRALAKLLKRQSPQYIIVERDGRFGYYDEVLQDVTLIRRQVATCTSA